MKLNEGKSPEDMDEIYIRLCERLDEEAEPAKQLFLARLCLLLVGELSDKQLALALIDAARTSHLESQGDNHATK